MSSVKSKPDRSDVEFISDVYEQYKGIMYKTALDCLHDDADKDAVVHDSIIRLTEHVDTLRRLDKNALAVYVATTVRSVAINREKRRSVDRRRMVNADIMELGGIEAGPSYEDQLIEAEARRDRLRYLREALAELSEADRDLLVRKYISDESDEALAERLGVKPDSVRMKLTRARRRVKTIIERKEGRDGLL